MVGLHMGRMMGEYFLPLLKEFEFLQYLKHDQSVPDSDVTPGYCARHLWIVGSPSTVTEKIARIHDEVGGFGHLLVLGSTMSSIRRRGDVRWAAGEGSLASCEASVADGLSATDRWPLLKGEAISSTKAGAPSHN